MHEETITVRVVVDGAWIQVSNERKESVENKGNTVWRVMSYDQSDFSNPRITTTKG